AFATLPSSSAFASEDVKFTVSAGLEYDDNISVPSLDQTTGESDVAAVFDFGTSYTPIKANGKELDLTYDFYQSLHETYDDFDLQIHTLSVLGSWEIGDLDTSLSYGYSRIYLGGSELYASYTVTPSVGFSGAESWYHLLSYAYLDKDFDSTSGRDAKQHNTASHWIISISLWITAHVVLRLRAEDENAKDGELDYQGALVKVGLSTPLMMNSDVKLKVSYQHYWRDYDNVTASIAQKRDDEQGLVNIDLIKSLGDDMSVKLSYEYINADSNLSSADYNGNVGSVNFMMDF
ncbi:MAG: hypothetical protein JKX87_04875, partial [Cycloclasticus sp.]|nr:hypothetical protein [Cycloclasticus sp.]